MRKDGQMEDAKDATEEAAPVGRGVGGMAPNVRVRGLRREPTSAGRVHQRGPLGYQGSEPGAYPSHVHVRPQNPVVGRGRPAPDAQPRPGGFLQRLPAQRPALPVDEPRAPTAPVGTGVPTDSSMSRTDAADKPR